MSSLKPNQFRLPSGQIITETGLICQPDMAAAIYQDRKTETRRMNGLDLINEAPEEFEVVQYSSDEHYIKDLGLKPGYYALWKCTNPSKIEWWYSLSTYGKPGDLLYVRENFKLGSWREDGRMAFDYMASPELTNTHWCRFTDEEDPDGEKFEVLIEKAADILTSRGIPTDENGHFHWEPGKSSLPWKPSIHMPKIASRIWMMIEEVRVERVQDIREEDAIAEGIEPATDHLSGLFRDYTGNKTYSHGDLALHRTVWVSAKTSFQSLWTSINGEASWKSNPWVWVVKFRLLSKTGRPSLEAISDAYDQVVNRTSSIVPRKEASHA